MVQSPNGAPGLLAEVWATRCWRLFPMLLIYMTGATVLVPHVPGMLTDYFAERRVGHAVLCSGLLPDAPAADAAACQNAHSDVVTWSSWTAFLSNSIVSLLLTPLLGHLSDMNGRKPFFLLSQACSCVPLTIITLHLTSGLPLIWYYLANIFTSAVSAITVSLSFCADLLSPCNRGPTFGLLMACFAVAFLVGPAAGASLPPTTAALVALAAVGVTAAYTLLFLPESLSPEARAAARRHHRQHLQQDAATSAAAAAAGRPADGSSVGIRAGRALEVAAAACAPLAATLRALRILLRSPLFKRLTLCMMLSGVVLEGLQDLLVQFLQLRFHGDFGVRDVSYIFMIFGASALVVQTLLLSLLLRVLGEKRVLMVALAASAGQQLIIGLAAHKWQAFAGIAMGSLGSLSWPTISSMKANNAQEHEQGSVQGALYGARALASGTGPIIFAQLFRWFSVTDSPFPYFPGAPFMFGSALMLVAMGVASTIPVPAAVPSAAMAAEAGCGCEEEGGQLGGTADGVDEEGGVAWGGGKQPESADELVLGQGTAAAAAGAAAPMWAREPAAEAPSERSRLLG